MRPATPSPASRRGACVRASHGYYGVLRNNAIAVAAKGGEPSRLGAARRRDCVGGAARSCLEISHPQVYTG
jgi:hypothetical protein